MAITVNWGAKIISVLKTDMSVIQPSPEVRELDVDVFRLALKDLEDSEDGMAHLDTHVHNTEVTISGLIFARTIEIINGYTIEFENDNYLVLCTGANHNIYDVMVANNVSINPNLSAGLIHPDGFSTEFVASAVWNEAVADHLSAGTFGQKVGAKLLTLAKFIGLK